MFKKFIICTIVACSTFSQAQQGTSSPYSFYGIGSLKFKGTRCWIWNLRGLVGCARVRVLDLALQYTWKSTNVKKM